MELTSRQVDDIFAAMKKYEEDHFGMRNGDDFPLVAKALSESDVFRKAANAASSLILLKLATTVLENTTAEHEAREKLLDEVITKNPEFKLILADIFFAGYKMGQAHSEVDSLKKLESL